ncbi:MAG: class II glutamine amidotransferase [bacterium]
MCRFLAYIGKPIILDQLLYEPKNSLVRQSYHALERKEPLNGDGFGVGFYIPQLDPTPALFVSTTPAWNNRNLRYNAPKILSNCIFAHVRAASYGSVSEANCHPFHYNKFLFMHNGEIGGFKKIKRRLRERLSDEIYNWLEGDTDSEHFFAFFLEIFLARKRKYTASDIVDTLDETLAEVLELVAKHGNNEPSYLNVAITDGKVIVASKCTLGPSSHTATLYHSEGSRFVCENGVCRMLNADPSEHSVLVVSEKLTDVKEDWHEVPKNHFVVVKENLSVSLVPIKAC